MPKENSLKKNMELDMKVKQMEKDLSKIKKASLEIVKLIAKGVIGAEAINLFRKIF